MNGMDNPFIIVIIVGAVLIGAFAFVFVKKKQAAADQSSHSIASKKASFLAAPETEGELIEIPIAQLPATTVLNENHLSEITDITVVSRLSALVPVAAQTATRQAANSAAKALQGAELVKLDIPFSQLAKSKDVPGAARAFVRNKSSITKNANVTKVDMTPITKTTAIANGVANVMNIGSLVVGQYYMTEISDKLEKISDGIDKISDFQNREFKSRIISLIARVGKYSTFSAEIIENDETRLRILGVIENLEGDATELLGQVNIVITDIIQKTPSPSYPEYQSKINDFGILVEYQNALIAVLAEISRLAHLLGKGGISSEMSYSLYHKFLEQSARVRGVLEQWHDRQVELLKIDLDKNRKSKNWFAALPGLVNETWKYQPLAQGLVDKINSQSQTEALSPRPTKDIFEEDVEIIIRDGKYYYLHDAEHDGDLAAQEELKHDELRNQAHS